MNKIIKTRKPRKCEICDRDIPVGSEAMFYTHRVKRMDPEDEYHQIGVEFFRGYHCLNDCDKPESCQNGEHTFTTVTIDEDGEQVEFCENCYRTREEIPSDGIFTYKPLKS